MEQLGLAVSTSAPYVGGWVMGGEGYLPCSHKQAFTHQGSHVTTCLPPADTVRLMCPPPSEALAPHSLCRAAPWNLPGPGARPAGMQASITGPALHLLVVQNAQGRKPGDLASHLYLLCDLA